MKRFFTCIAAVIGLVLLSTAPALANGTTLSAGYWSTYNTYGFTVNAWPEWENEVVLFADFEGQQCEASVREDDGSWFARFGYATADQWEWEEVVEPDAVVDLYDLGLGYSHSIIGPLGLGFEADGDVLVGSDSWGDFAIYAGGLRVGPVLEHDFDMILGTWTLKAYAMAGPAIQVIDSDPLTDPNLYESCMYGGLTARWGAEVGYLLFDFIGVTAGVSQRYDLSPWGENDGDMLTSSQCEWYLRGALRF